MRKILQKAAAAALAACLCLSAVLTVSSASTSGKKVQVGLAYDSNALVAANLENNTGYGAGYRFGYFDSNLKFVQLGSTKSSVTRITMLRACDIYYNGSQYTNVKPSGSYTAIGCYHVVLGNYSTFQKALAALPNYKNAFVAWIQGQYQLRVGTYTTKAEAVKANSAYGGIGVRGTSRYAVNVVQTGSTKILFQFDGGSSRALGVMPDVTGKGEVRTWFKGYKYRGGFRYERVGGGNLTVVNILDMETYIKGVIPYEMSNSWPLEALKAQAVCARSYAYNNLKANRHDSQNFDLCNTADCQVYRGVGSNNSSYQSNTLTDRAVEETAGKYALYNGKPIEAYYASSHGGGSEQIDYVWNSSLSKYPYLCGVVDPYEKDTASINTYSSWTRSWTNAELTSRLRRQGYALNTEVKSLSLTYTPRGNAVKVQVNFTNGTSKVFTPKMNWGLKSLLGVRSLHFTVNGKGVVPVSSSDPAADLVVPVNGGTGKLNVGDSLYVAGGTGSVTLEDTGDLYVLSGSNSVSALDPDRANKDDAGNTVITVTGPYTIKGSGNGHQLGMSQYGAYAMAKKGYTYDTIVEFYYPGVKVDSL